MLKVVIAGGSGNVGTVLRRGLAPLGWELVVLSRSGAAINGVRSVTWDGKSVGPWQQELNNADVVINLAGRSVNCRYGPEHLKEMLESRTESTRAIGRAIAACSKPPKVWLQASTATIYAHRFDAPNDERTGILGGDELDAPRTWNASIQIARVWEAELDASETPQTRKVAMRSAMTMSPDRGSVFWVLARLARLGLGGRLGSGKQYVSWIHEGDFVSAVQFIIEHDELSGPVNLCSPNPLPQEEFARELRRAVGAGFAMPAPEWLIEIGTFFLRTESELVLKSRQVVPSRLIEAGFEFRFPIWSQAAKDLAKGL